VRFVCLFSERAFVKSAITAAPSTLRLGGNLQVAAIPDVNKSYLGRVPKKQCALKL